MIWKITIIVALIWGIYKLYQYRKNAPVRYSSKFPYDDAMITWCAGFLGANKQELVKILKNTPKHYKHFRLRKRKGGSRKISAPVPNLKLIQQTIYLRSLLPVHLHSAATGFRQGMSIVDNASVHLGNKYILKTDIHDFFGSIHTNRVQKVFEKIGYPEHVAKILTHLCCLNRCLPQGAPTSPALSNIIAYEMDRQLTLLARRYNLTYSRYADDLTFSGNLISDNALLLKVKEIVEEQKFKLNDAKTRFIKPNNQKIVTGISISSGVKLTIPKKKKRELRQIIYFIRTKGLDEHKKYIQSTDSIYLKRIIGYLYFWLSVEPDNQYVRTSIDTLEKIGK